MALLSFDVGSYQPWAQRSRERSVSDTFLPSEDRQKPWSAYGLLCRKDASVYHLGLTTFALNPDVLLLLWLVVVVLVIILAPQPSILLVCVKYYQATTQSRFGLLGKTRHHRLLSSLGLPSLIRTLWQVT